MTVGIESRILIPFVNVASGNFLAAKKVATACALALKAQKLICIIDDPILDESGRLINFLSLQDADKLIRERAIQSETTANYVEAVGLKQLMSVDYNRAYGLTTPHVNGKTPGSSYYVTFQNGVGFDNGNGLWATEQGFAIGGEEKLSRINGYLSELVAAAAFVCRLMEAIESFYVVEREGHLIACAALFPYYEEKCGEVASIVVSP